MADKVAMKLGKRYMGKHMKSNELDSGNAYKYVKIDKRGKKILMKKNMEYFVHELHIPKEDAAILYKVMSSARSLDGTKIGPFRFGKSTIIGLFPGFGDAINGLLSMSIIWKADKISGKLEKSTRAKMVLNVVIEVAIGATPVLGDFCDTLFQANSRNALLLEETLKKRVRMAAEEKMKEMEENGHTHARVPVETDGQYDHEARSGRYEREVRSKQHDRQVRSESPLEHDDRHAALRNRLLAGDNEHSNKSTQGSRGGGSSGWLNKLQGRGQDTTQRDGRGTNLVNPATKDIRRHDAMREEDAAPARPPRTGAKRHHQVGSF